ncbi:MAG: NAD(P)-dependent oxidoreductase [Candidatus Competibacterales bacterium]
MGRIAFLGLGAMGAPMAMNLVKAGHPVTVWNRSGAAAEPLVAAGATAAPSPREAALDAEFVISMVSDDQASREVWLDDSDGALAGLAARTVAVESSTLTPGWILELSSAVTEGGGVFLDAPVAGSRPQAEAGQLIFLVGGEAAVLERARPLLAAMGGAIHHAGSTGNGATIKLVVNTLLATQSAVVGELLGYLDKAGLDLAKAGEVLSQIPVVSPAAAGMIKLMLNRAFAPLFPIDLVVKDLDYAVASAWDVGASLPTTTAVAKAFKDVQQRGHGAENISAVVQLFRP